MIQSMDAVDDLTVKRNRLNKEQPQKRSFQNIFLDQEAKETKRDKILYTF